jgi:hypothetical protein
MPSETEILALHLVRALYDSTGRRPQVWRMLEKLDGVTADAIVFAVARGWVVVQSGHSICLADAGRRLVEVTRKGHRCRQRRCGPCPRAQRPLAGPLRAGGGYSCDSQEVMPVFDPVSRRPTRFRFRALREPYWP